VTSAFFAASDSIDRRSMSVCAPGSRKESALVPQTGNPRSAYAQARRPPLLSLLLAGVTLLLPATASAAYSVTVTPGAVLNTGTGRGTTVQPRESWNLLDPVVLNAALSCDPNRSLPDDLVGIRNPPATVS
jgi:hypothetical protein